MSGCCAPRLAARSRRTRLDLFCVGGRLFCWRDLGRAYSYGAHSVGSQSSASLGCLFASRAARHKIHWLETLDQYPIASLSPRLRRSNLPYLGAVSIGLTAIALSQVHRDVCPCVDMRVLPSSAPRASLGQGDPDRSDCALPRLARVARVGGGAEPNPEKIMGCPSPRYPEPDQLERQDYEVLRNQALTHIKGEQVSAARLC